MLSPDLQDLVETAWNDANGDALTTVNLVRERTGHGLIAAARLVNEAKGTKLAVTNDGVKYDRAPTAEEIHKAAERALREALSRTH